MAADSQITYKVKVTLRAPPGGVLKCIIAKIEMSPADGGCLIYGRTPDGDMGFLEVRGSQERIELPFAHPEIYVKYLKGLKRIEITTLGYRDAARSG